MIAICIGIYLAIGFVIGYATSPPLWPEDYGAIAFSTFFWLPTLLVACLMTIVHFGGGDL